MVMANETGGRADKFGNKFEKNCIINYYIDVVREKIKYCSFEKIGDDEKGTDIIIEDFKNKHICYGSIENMEYSK